MALFSLLQGHDVGKLPEPEGRCHRNTECPLVPFGTAIECCESSHNELCPTGDETHDRRYRQQEGEPLVLPPTVADAGLFPRNVGGLASLQLLDHAFTGTASSVLRSSGPYQLTMWKSSDEEISLWGIPQIWAEENRGSSAR